MRPRLSLAAGGLLLLVLLLAAAGPTTHAARLGFPPALSPSSQQTGGDLSAYPWAGLLADADAGRQLRAQDCAGALHAAGVRGGG